MAHGHSHGGGGHSHAASKPHVLTPLDENVHGSAMQVANRRHSHAEGSATHMNMRGVSTHLSLFRGIENKLIFFMKNSILLKIFTKKSLSLKPRRVYNNN
jgi:hypothetical protein